jgi:hypothetical protein
MRIGLPCLVVISVAAFAQDPLVPPGDGVTIRGNVNRPGVYPILVHETIKTAIGQAGGFLSRFDENAYVYRTDNEGMSHTILIPLRKIMERRIPDIDLQPGDVVNVPFSRGIPPKKLPIIDVPIPPPDKERA